MIYLKKLPFVDSLESMQEIASLDSVANLKKHLAALQSWVPSHYRKADYAMVIHAHFLTYPMRSVDALPDNERKVITQLIGMKADEYLTWPLRNDKELRMQTLHLVISYKDGKQWRLYMPDCIRRELRRGYDELFARISQGLSLFK